MSSDSINAPCCDSPATGDELKTPLSQHNLHIIWNPSRLEAVTQHPGRVNRAAVLSSGQRRLSCGLPRSGRGNPQCLNTTLLITWMGMKDAAVKSTAFELTAPPWKRFRPPCTLKSRLMWHDICLAFTRLSLVLPCGSVTNPHHQESSENSWYSTLKAFNTPKNWL